MSSNTSSESESDDHLASSSKVENSESEERSQIREDLSSMTFEEILKLKEELGAKIYNEAMFGVESSENKKKARRKETTDFKRLNKNRPRETSSKKQVPFLGAELRTKSGDKKLSVRDPRFEESSGSYDPKQFKENYKFVTKIRENEVTQLKKQLMKTADTTKKTSIMQTMQRLANKNVEDLKWHKKQAMLKQEKQDLQKARAEGKQPHYITKKERRAKELVMQFEYLKNSGKLNKHLEKRRKKNVAKDRKVMGFD